MTASTAGSNEVAAQFLKFGVVGTVGFVVDAGALHALLALTDLGLYLGRIVSFLLAATTTWALNRTFTFAGTADAPRLRQWARFVSVNAGGGAVNYGVYAALLLTFDGLRAVPIVAVGAGAVAGLAVNFTASRRFVFRSTQSAPDALN